MKALVVAATRAELGPIYSHFNLPNQDFVACENFDIIITGVGMVATAFSLGKLLDRNNYNLILNLGIAGCFDSAEPLGKLYSITNDSFADFGAEDKDNFLSIEEMGFGKQTFVGKTTLKLDLPEATGITVNTISGNAKTIAHRKSRWAAKTESMEGAAVFYAASLLSIDTIQIRSISNYVEPRDKTNWNIGLAVQNLNRWAIGFLEHAPYS